MAGLSQMQVSKAQLLQVVNMGVKTNSNKRKIKKSDHMDT
eukprot:CAMPEP_0114648682 /NCGR_PEP_ID=MMETSP0191-20121206/6564_1 /TAXON_ID=126664 /ORGANISM="Sorites sp." /LENGTH=39 /DNA_ID= /DNA_START= /DNA_END= /DNA_ORIENTATION=